MIQLFVVFFIFYQKYCGYVKRIITEYYLFVIISLKMLIKKALVLTRAFNIFGGIKKETPTISCQGLPYFFEKILEFQSYC